jgi:hypothetical protein
MSATSRPIDTPTVVRRSLFFLLLVLLTLGNLFILFKGLNSPQAMDQAQIAREIARGNGFTTKFIRPAAYYQASQAHPNTPFSAFGDTYHSPLNPLINAAVLKAVGADKPDSWKMNENQMVFPLDRVIAAVSTVFFLMAIGVSYLLISRIFDPKIAGVCALLMLLCETYWGFSLSGLPQMLLLLLFSCGMYFTYRAVEESAEGRMAMSPAILAGVFFTLMALTHWLAVWIALGYIIYSAVAFRPRGIIGVSVLGMLVVAAIFPIIRNVDLSGSPLGTAFLVFYKGLGGTEDMIMRTQDLMTQPPSLDGLTSRILRMMLLQATDIVPFLGGIVVAPLFFISLLHPFRRPAIARFRWAILLMWVTAAFGMAIFGVSTKEALDPNQIHLVFAPLMTAYGLAFLSILWSRLDVVVRNPVLRNVHHYVAILICAAPFLLAMPQDIRRGFNLRDRGGVPWWPPYYAPALNLGLKNWIKPDQLCFSDQPWAVAWYADRISVWLPTNKEGFEKLEATAGELGTKPVGILVTPMSYGTSDIRTVSDQYGDLTPLILDGRVILAAQPNNVTLFEKAPRLQSMAKRYPYRNPLLGIDLLYYSDLPIRRSE